MNRQLMSLVKQNRQLPKLCAIVVGMAIFLVGCVPVAAPADGALEGGAGDGTIPNASTAVPADEPQTTTPAESATEEPVPEDSATEESGTEEPETEETPMAATPESAAAPDASAPVEQAKADLAQRLSVDAAEIETVEVRDVAWRDGSMGCPEPGMMYTQVIIEGMKIILTVDGEEYHYHAGRNREPFLCENPADDGAVGG